MKRVTILCILFIYSLIAHTQPKARRLEILFLGDNGHHKPMNRMAQIMSGLGSKGINFTYTDQLADINDENLSLYDAVLIFANWDEIPPAAEKALLKYVDSGKGILPIHCASWCFRNSPEFVKMVGGQFWRHTVDTISVNMTQPNHPILADIKSLKTYDETYLHSQLQPDNDVLMSRDIKPDQYKDKPGQKTEPYTWTRSYGKGKVFYTALGHDEVTWGNADFQQLIYNGILHVVDNEAKAAFLARNPQPFTYKMAQLPNYEKREEPQVQQGALSPAESMKHIQIPAGFELSLFAAEPNVMHPIAMAWDERGRLFVLITKDYPNERKDNGGSDYILICEDTDKDDKADKFTKFADGLSIPTGLVFADGGLVVSQAPHMIFLKDTNGDDVADEKRILFSGFGTGDTHAGPSNLHYGFDNWIYGCVGYSGFQGKVNAQSDSLKFGQAFFKFKTGISTGQAPELQWITSTSNNTWGMSFNESGEVFGSTANNAHGWYMAIPHQHFLTPGHNTDNGSRSTDTHKDMKTITPRVRQVDVFGGYTAASGHNFYTARAFPKSYWNQVAFVSEPTGHVLHQNRMVKKGTNYEDKEAFNLMAGADEWFSPVFAQVGPDGAVWVADWYSFIIQHNPKPDGFKMGVGNAYETDLRDYTHGRIYRVGYKKAPVYQPISLNKNDTNGLLAALKSDNLFWRMHAQRLLVENKDASVLPSLLSNIADNSTDELGLNTAAIHSIWAIKGLGLSEKTEAKTALIQALTHTAWAVRKNAIQALNPSNETAQLILDKNLLNDTEALVQLAAILKLQECTLTVAQEERILAEIKKSNASTDRWLPDAYSTILSKNEGKLMKRLLAEISQQAQPEKVMDHSMHQNHTAMATKPEPVSAKGIDLVVSNLIFENPNPKARENTKYSIEIQNKGLDSLKNGQTIMLKVDISGQGLTSTNFSHVYNKGLAAGQKVIITKNTNGPWSGDLAFGTDIAGDYQFRIAIDYENKITENNEKNNGFSGKLVFSQSSSLAQLAVERSMRSMGSYLKPDGIYNLLADTKAYNAPLKSSVIASLTAGYNMRNPNKLSPSLHNAAVEFSKNLVGKDLENIQKLYKPWGVKLADDNKVKFTEIRIKAVVEAMKFNQKEIRLKAGQTYTIVFDNPDGMQHNLVIGKPNSLAIIGKAADKMITDPKAIEKNYVPEVPQVLAASPLVNAGDSYSFTFSVPKQPGLYPFVCTFPGHWRLMNGVFRVQK